MRKVLSITVAMVFCFIATLAYAHHGPAKVVINEAAKKQPGVPFDHAKHSTTLVKTCDTCHHTDKGLTKDTDKNVKKCASCHLDPAKPTTPSMREMSMQKNPFHITCINCHKSGKKGPTVCKDCHKK